MPAVTTPAQQDKFRKLLLAYYEALSRRSVKGRLVSRHIDHAL